MSAMEPASSTSRPRCARATSWSSPSPARTAPAGCRWIGVVVRDSGPRLLRYVQVTLEPAPEPPSASEVDRAAAVRAALASVDARVAELPGVGEEMAGELLELAGRMHARLDAGRAG